MHHVRPLEVVGAHLFILDIVGLELVDIEHSTSFTGVLIILVCRLAAGLFTVSTASV